MKAIGGECLLTGVALEPFMVGSPTPLESTAAPFCRSSAMERLVKVVQELSHVRDINAVTAIVREAARTLTGADGATFVLRDGDQCFYVDENAIAPLWKGRRFPMSACISGWVMLNGSPAVIGDIYRDPRIPVEAYRPTFVKSLVMVPIRRAAPIGAIGNYWAACRQPSPEEVEILQALADTTSVALENAELYGRLQQQVITLQEQEARIRDQHGKLEIFTRALAHDLREPVRTMKSFSRLLDTVDTAENRTKYTGFIQTASDRMGMLIDSVSAYLQLDEPSRGHSESCAMQEIFTDVQAGIAQLITESGAVIEGAQLPAVRANPAHMAQLMQNLIANAIRHNDKPVQVQVSAEPLATGWKFVVRDNGCGVSPEYTQAVFLPFKRLTHRDGCSGLGLAICHKIVSQYGGRIWCEPTPGGGASFCFTLPGARERGFENSLSPARRGETDEQSPPLARMLLVDDRPDDRELMRIMLARRAKLECELLDAHDGPEALEVLARERVDIVLLDINMPGMDGFEMLERMRNNRATEGIPVIMCTGSSQNQDRRRARELGAQGYLLKPPNFDELRPLLAALPGLRLTRMGAQHTLLRAAETPDQKLELVTG